ncbi:MAG: hypothetical protein ACRC07_06130 [Pseudomonas paracarnis]
MDIDKEKLKGLLWAEAASYRADCADWKYNTEALDEFLGEKTVGEVALELLAENEALRKGAGRYEWLRDKQTFIWLIQDWFPSDAEFTDVDAVIDAAMGKGQQS